MLSGQPATDETLTCAFWNVENLFDLADDPTKNDDEFALGGVKKVTRDIFDLKIEHLVEVLTDLNADILGLCEVENRYVLDQLNLAYAGRDYSIIHFESPDERGIDNALCYDPTVFNVTHQEAIPVRLPDDNPTRDILYVRGNSQGKELHLFINHWPSKYGGVEATIPLRAIAGKTLKSRIDAIQATDPDADIVCLGDLNDEPYEPSITQHLGAVLYKNQSPSTFSVVNLMTEIHEDPNRGTYMYRGEHDVIDNIIVSRGLFDKIGWNASLKDIFVLDKPEYVQQSGDYKGYPFRFWAGNRLLGGYSDHLAIMITLHGK